MPAEAVERGERNHVVKACAVALVLLGTASPLAAAGPFRAGAAEVDIGPRQFPVIVNAMFTERSATNVVDPLAAKALVLDDGQTRIAFCVVDTCMMPRDLIDAAKRLAAGPAGVPSDHMVVSATHTHSAPSAMACLGSRADPAYAAWLPGKIAEAIVAAAERLTPAQIAWGVTEDWEHTFNRRWIRRPDRMLTDPFGERTVRAHMHPGYENPDAIGPSGPVDPGLSVVAVRTRGGRPLAVLANYSQHYYDSPLLSSDYYGRFARHLADLLGTDAASPAFVGLMSQGTSGDLMWMDYGSPAHTVGYDAYAREIAVRVADVYRDLRWQEWVPLKMVERTLDLDYRVPGPERLAWARSVALTLTNRLPQTLPEIYALEALHLHERRRTELKLQALRLGELGIAAIPNEVFALTGLKLKARSPLQPTFTIALANGAEGYIPPPEQHALGGYTTWPARTAGLEVTAEPRIVEAVLGLFEHVSGRPTRRLEAPPGPYARSILAARPLTYWRMDDASGPALRDATSRHWDAWCEAGVAFYLPGAGSGAGRKPQPALCLSAFSDAAVNRAVQMAGGRVRAWLARPGRHYSVELWCWNALPHEARAITGYLLSRGAEGDTLAGGEHLAIGGTNTPAMAGRLILHTGRTEQQGLVGRTPLRPKTWHHVVVTRRHRWATIYLDGRLEAEGELEPPPGTETPLFLGDRCDRTASLEGRLDEVATYDRVLTAREIEAHFRLGGVSAPPGNSAHP